MRRLILIHSHELPPSQVLGKDIALAHYQRFLGASSGDIYYDASNGLMPNAFAAICGGIARRHHLYLHLPEHYPQGDPDHHRLLDEGGDITLCQPFFNQRLRRFADNAHAPSSAVAQECVLPSSLSEGHVLIGRRGSGKSSTIAKWLNTQKNARILLIAPHRSQCVQILASHPDLPFLPPDEAIRRKPSYDLMIIDEAASLAPQQLLTLCTHYPRYILSTTTDSYEGSANTFLLKTLPLLQGARIHHLDGSYRYQMGDPLDYFARRLFPDDPLPAPSHSNYHITRLSQETLAQDEGLLRQIWQLLKMAHYRTQPQDLKRLLDLPYQDVWVAITPDRHILACAQVLSELPYANMPVEVIMQGKRRPKGRLLMQQLLLRSQNKDWARAPLYRISRIATHTALRRQGIASALMQAIINHYGKNIGVVHVDNPELDKFWQNMDFSVRYRSDVQRAKHHAPNVLRLLQ